MKPNIHKHPTTYEMVKGSKDLLRGKQFVSYYKQEAEVVHEHKAKKQNL